MMELCSQHKGFSSEFITVCSQPGSHGPLAGPHEGYFELSFPSGALSGAVFEIMKNEHFEGPRWNGLYFF